MPLVRPPEQAEGPPERLPKGRCGVFERVRCQDRPPDDGGPHADHLRQEAGPLPLLQAGLATNSIPFC